LIKKLEEWLTDEMLEYLIGGKFLENMDLRRYAKRRIDQSVSVHDSNVEGY
jgi:hypothetical protein